MLLLQLLDFVLVIYVIAEKNHANFKTMIDCYYNMPNIGHYNISKEVLNSLKIGYI